MRASRLLEILMLLQVRGRVTAGELAERLEVSVRTIQRDMDALSAAGIPVFALRGGQGGWTLTEGFRTTLTSLTPSEALALAVGRPEGVMEDLGLEDPGELAFLKVMASSPDLAREAAEHARQRLHVDLLPWSGARADATVLPTLRAAAAEDRVVRIAYGGGPPVRVAPLGLVCKGVVWYLVALKGGQHRTYRVSRIRSVDLTDDVFERPAGFDLPAHWRQVRTNLRRTLPSFTVTLRVRGDALRRLRWVVGSDLALEPADVDGWSRATVDLENEHEACSVVLSLGADAVVDAPSGLRSEVATAARQIAANNG